MVPHAHGVEGLRRDHAHDLVHLVAELVAGLRRRRRHTHDQAGRSLPAQRGGGGAHGRAGRQPVVDEDDRPVPHVGRRAVVAVGPLAPLQLRLLPGGHRLDRLGRDAQRVDHVRVEHARAARGESAHGQLFVAGHPQFAHQEDVERRTERLRDLEADRDAAARQRQHDHVGATGVVLQPGRQLPARIGSIAKIHGVPGAPQTACQAGVAGRSARRLSPARPPRARGPARPRASCSGPGRLGRR